MNKILVSIRQRLSDCISDIETIKDELQEKFDSKTEEWQESDAGTAIEDQIQELTAVSEGLDENLSSLVSVIESMGGK